MVSRFLQAAGVEPYWLAVAALGVAVISYFLGCFNGSVVVSRYILRDDVRTHGSGNAGLTNFYRTFGGPLTAAVILSDVVKAILAVGFAVFIAGRMSPELTVLAKYWSGTFCLLGHMYPCTFQFRGGKGILSGGTIVWMIDWRVGLVAWGGFLILVLLTRYVSLGSCWAALSFPFSSGILYRDTLVTVLATVVGGLILWKHRGNIVRLVQGTESKFTLHKNAAAPPAEGGSQAETAPPAPEPELAPERTAETTDSAEKPAGETAPAAEQTGKTSETGKPSGTDKTPETGKPSGTDKPSETDKTSGTGKASEAGKTSETGKPSGTGKTSETDKPSGTDNPSGAGKASAGKKKGRSGKGGKGKKGGRA